ncbi:MAG: sigma-70 family RNA polymerase sigma factor [Actinomycetota bacterium]|nr:sigma-70 family RNA polymerase sigma factor [Actinomycetota bacterium]
MPPEPLSPPPAVPSEDELVRENLPLVNYAVAEVVSRVPRHVSRDDLVSAGMSGLAQAARSYDPSRAASFPRFATTRIRGAILDELRSRDWATRSVRARAREVAAASERLTARLGRTPSTAELADHLGMERSDLESLDCDLARSVVLNLEDLAPSGSADDSVVTAELGPDAQLIERERRAYLVAAVANLPERLRRVVMGYFFEELPMHVLAVELGVTDSRISQMRSEALVLLKQGMDAQLEPAQVPASGADAEAAGIRRPGASRGSRRRDSYIQAVANHHDFRTRLSPASATLASLATA